MVEQDYYELLGVARGADYDVLLVRQYDPRGSTRVRRGEDHGERTPWRNSDAGARPLDGRNIRRRAALPRRQHLTRTGNTLDRSCDPAANW